MKQPIQKWGFEQSHEKYYPLILDDYPTSFARFNPNSLGNSPNKFLDYHYHFSNQLLLFRFNYLSPSLHELPPHSPHLPHREA